MQTYLLSFIPILMQSDGSSIWTLISFGGLLLVLLMILKGGKPRVMPTVVESKKPQDWTDDPIFAENRRKAVAAAYATHLHASAKGPSQ